MAEARPLVSIGLPTLDGERWLAEALESLLAQSYDNLEIVISDNASTDGTARIVDDFAGRDGRIRSVRNQNVLRQFENFNQAFRLSGGDFFMWAGDHDRWEPAFVEVLVEALAANPRAALAYPQSGHIDADGRLQEVYDSAINTEGLAPQERFWKIYSDLTRCNMIFGLYRSEKLRRTHLIGPVIGGDRLLLSELGLVGEIVHVPQCLFYLRRNRPEENAYQAEQRRIQALYATPEYKWRRLTPHVFLIEEFLHRIIHADLPEDAKTALINQVASNAPRKFPYLNAEVETFVRTCKAILERTYPNNYFVFEDMVEVMRLSTLISLLYPNLQPAKEIRQAVLQRWVG